MLIPLTDFPVHPAKNPGESLVGYVHRFYWENGHEVPIVLRGALRDLYLGDNLISAFFDLEYVVGEFGMADKAWWVTRCLDAAPPGVLPPKWRRLHHSPVHYCPTCLQESGFHADLWTLPLVEACPIHQCLLLSRCTACDQVLSWRALRPGWHCRCGVRLGTVRSRMAPKWAIRLAADVQRAMGHAWPVNKKDKRAASILFGGSNSLHEIYNALEIVHSIRCQLTRRPKRENGSRRLSSRKASPDTPGALEVQILLGETCALEWALRRLLKRSFEYEQSMLVVFCDEEPIGLAIKALDGLLANRHAEGLHCQAKRLLGELHAGIESGTDVCATIYFHPRFSDIDRQPYLAEFARWWYALASRLSALEPEARLVGEELWIDPANKIELVVQILNLLLAAACRREGVERYSKLTARWHIPEMLQRKLDPSEVLKQVGGYLGKLRPTELAFVLDLLNDGQGHSAWQ